MGPVTNLPGYILTHKEIGLSIQTHFDGFCECGDTGPGQGGEMEGHTQVEPGQKG